MASPSAPSPMPPTPQPTTGSQQQQQSPLTANDFRPKSTDEQKIDEFAANMRAQVEIFVNRMKSNSSRGRSIANDSSVQTLFMTLTGLHSQQLSFIKELDDKRMWYEQLQDKLAQIKDSRAALDDLRNEHAENLRRMAEEQERQRQIQMAQKLEIMRKKKQEYLQYQRQLALHRIQEQEREMQMRQEQQMAQYRMGQTAFPFMPPMAGMPPQGSPSQQPQMASMPPGVYNPYSPNATTTAGGVMGGMPPFHSPHTTQAGMVPPGMYSHPVGAGIASNGPQSLPPQGTGNMMMPPQQHQPPITQPQTQNHIPGGMLPSGPMGGEPQQQQQQQQQPPQLAAHNSHQTQVNGNSIPVTNNQGPISAAPPQPHPQQPQLVHVMLQQQHQQQFMHAHSPIPHMGNMQIPPQTTMPVVPPPPTPQQVQNPPQQQALPQPQPQQPPPAAPQQAATQIQAVQAAPAPPQHEPEPVAPPAPEEPATAELISFD